MNLFLEFTSTVFIMSAAIAVALIVSTFVGMQYDKKVNHTPLILSSMGVAFWGIVYLLVWSAF